ncbi:MAG TPA: lipoprotein [Variovorax sp.]
MLNVRKILLGAFGLAIVGAGVAACGQRGPLFLPTDPAAKGRATLPSFVLPDSLTRSAAPAPAAPGSAPATPTSAPAAAASAPAAASSAPAPAGVAK